MLISSVDYCGFSCIFIPESPVVFTLPLTNATVQEGQSVTLTCETNKPSKQVTWLKNKKKLASSETSKAVDEGISHSLTLTNVTLAESAEYMAKIGDVTTSAVVTVEGKTNSSYIHVPVLFDVFSDNILRHQIN